MPELERRGPHQMYRHPRVAFETRTLGELAPDRVRVKMTYGGLCGTDLHAVESDPDTGYICTSSPASIPSAGRILGHEGIGRIAETGASVTHLPAGSWVVFDSIIACHACDRCARGHPNQCHQARLLGMEEDGLFSSIAEVPASIVHDVSEHIRSDEDARALALLEPAGVAYLACQNARVAPGNRVLVFGAGPIGIYCAMLAKTAFGAAEVEIIEPLPFRREFAAQWADRVSTLEEFRAGAGETIDVVFEASGDLENIGRVMRRMNAQGRILVLGRSGQPLRLTAIDHLITNALSISGSRGQLGGSFDALLRLFADDRFSPAAVVTRVVNGLENLAELLQTPARVSQHDCKVLIKI